MSMIAIEKWLTGECSEADCTSIRAQEYPKESALELSTLSIGHVLPVPPSLIVRYSVHLARHSIYFLAQNRSLELRPLPRPIGEEKAFHVCIPPVIMSTPVLQLFLILL